MDPENGVALIAASHPKDTRKKPKRKSKAKKSKAKRPAKSKSNPKAGGTIVRTERLDMRLSKAEKAKIMAKAKKTRRTVTSLIVEAIEKIKA